MPDPRTLRDHVAKTQAAISCVSRTVVLTDRRNVWLAENPTALKTPSELVWLTVQQELHDVSGRRAILARYNYRVMQADREVVAYHRHGGRHLYDHLHTSFGPLAGTAMPTGEISLEDVVDYCIRELAVIPLRRDWQQVLNI